MNCTAEITDTEAERRAYELKRMAVIRRLEDWAAYERRFGRPLLRNKTTSSLGALAAEKATSKRMGLEDKQAIVYVCNDCQHIFATEPQECLNCHNDKKGGFRRSRRESIAGKTVYASMIPSTQHAQSHRSEIETDNAIQTLEPIKREVLRRNYVTYLDQKTNAEEMGISRSTFQKELSAAIDHLVGYFEGMSSTKPK